MDTEENPDTHLKGVDIHSCRGDTRVGSRKRKKRL